jgi:hypothetical protein
MAEQVRYSRRRKGMRSNALGPEANTLQTKQMGERADWTLLSHAPASSHTRARHRFVLPGAPTSGCVQQHAIRVALTAAAFPGEGETGLQMGAATGRVWCLSKRTGTTRLRDETLHLQPRPISRPLTAHCNRGDSGRSRCCQRWILGYRTAESMWRVSTPPSPCSVCRPRWRRQRLRTLQQQQQQRRRLSPVSAHSY